MQYMQDERVLILGLGTSGLSMARWCLRCGARVRVVDTRELPPGLTVLQALVPDLDFVAGEFDSETLLSPMGGKPLTCVLRSPGLSPLQEPLKGLLSEAKQRQIPVYGELDLFVQALTQIDQFKKTQEELLSQELAVSKPLMVNDEVLLTELECSLASQEEEREGPDIGHHDENDGEFEDDETPIVIIPNVPLGYKPAVIAVTGTNGKTTVTSLVAQLAARAGKTVVAAGNIGLAMLDALSQKMDGDALPQVWVLELSSFQLEGVEHFEPTTATILNITQDHLDWHSSMAHYMAAKSRIFGKTTIPVINRDDEAVKTLLKPLLEQDKPLETQKKRRRPSAEPKVPVAVSFGLDVPSRVGDFGLLDEGGVIWLVQAQALDETQVSGEAGDVILHKLMPAEALRIQGRHNISNALASLALACSAGCELAPMLFGLREYRGEPHRTEFIGLINGVQYIEDSKGTNVGATAAALQGIGPQHRLVLILGGDGKGQDFSPLRPLVKKFVRAVVLIGRDASLIEEALQPVHLPVLHAQDMMQAVQLCAQQAHEGDAVLMSPACASLDMYANYAQRARAFVEAVQQVAQDQGQVVGGWQ